MILITHFAMKVYYSSDNEKKYFNLFDITNTRNMKSNRKPSDIDINGDYAEIVLRDKNCNEVCRAIIDVDDIWKVKEYRFRLSSDGYVRTKRNTLFIHRIILDCPQGMVVDHINGNKLDNRKYNLRICSQATNACNRTVLGKNNTSGYKGVNVLKNGTFTANISVKSRKIHLGTFKTIDDAIKARQIAADKYYKIKKQL